MSDFVAVLEAKRAAFQASVGTITKQEKPLNASSSDVLAQLKATASHLAHQAVLLACGKSSRHPVNRYRKSFRSLPNNEVLM